MGKRVRFDDEARQALWRGVDQLASAVRITLGPRGRSVVLDRLHGMPAITRDGVAVAQEVQLADPFENLGVQMLRDGAFQTAADAGDGTTTATVLAHALVAGGMRAVASGHHPTVVQRAMSRSVTLALESLAKHARPIGSARDLERVAVIAAGDRDLGELVAHALERVGRTGVVTLEEGRGLDTTLDVVEGARFDGGYASPYFITDADDMEATLDHPLVALARGTLESAHDVSTALELAARVSRPLLLVAEGLTGEALATLVVNRLRGTAPSIGVILGGPESRHPELLDDLAIMTGAAVVAPELGRSMTRFDTSWFGRARHVVVSRAQTTILQGGGASAELASRIAAAERDLTAASLETERIACRERLARLRGGIAVIRVGAATDFEREARRSRLEDALAATRSAVEEGIIPGGGLALLRAGDALCERGVKGVDAVARDAVRAALAEPARQIGVNAGLEGDVLVARLRAGDGAQGYNALSGRWVDLVAEGVLDPAKVARCALQNAASVGALVLTTDALVVDDDPGPEHRAA